jgi:hypothetical protein
MNNSKKTKRLGGRHQFDQDDACTAVCKRAFAVLLLLSAIGAVAGCGVGHLQTAKTTPKHHVELHAGWGYIHNETADMRGEQDVADDSAEYGVSNFPALIGARYGILDDLDIGLKMFFLAGMAMDVKYNFLDPNNPLAVSVLGGIGAADQIWAPHGAWVLNVPLSVLVSYDVKKNFTPYASLGYSTFWVFGRQRLDTDEQEYLNEWRGHGDGLLTASAGFRFGLSDEVGMFLEYDFALPLADDPGDFFQFVDTHIFLVGLSVRFRVFGSDPPTVRFPTPPAPPPPPPGPGPGSGERPEPSI